jgi:hypothetical protein
MEHAALRLAPLALASILSGCGTAETIIYCLAVTMRATEVMT